MAGPVRAPDSVSAPVADARLGWRAALLSYASYVAGVALATWPLARHPASLLPPHHDPPMFIWAMVSMARWLVAGPRTLFDGNAFYPYGKSLAFERIVAPPRDPGLAGVRVGRPGPHLQPADPAPVATERPGHGVGGVRGHRLAPGRLARRRGVLPLAVLRRVLPRVQHAAGRPRADRPRRLGAMARAPADALARARAGSAHAPGPHVLVLHDRHGVRARDADGRLRLPALARVALATRRHAGRRRPRRRRRDPAAPRVAVRHRQARAGARARPRRNGETSRGPPQLRHPVGEDPIPARSLARPRRRDVAVRGRHGPRARRPGPRSRLGRGSPAGRPRATRAHRRTHPRPGAGRDRGHRRARARIEDGGGPAPPARRHRLLPLARAGDAAHRAARARLERGTGPRPEAARPRGLGMAARPAGRGVGGAGTGPRRAHREPPGGHRPVPRRLPRGAAAARRANHGALRHPRGGGVRPPGGSRMAGHRGARPDALPATALVRGAGRGARPRVRDEAGHVRAGAGAAAGGPRAAGRSGGRRRPRVADLLARASTATPCSGRSTTASGS